MDKATFELGREIRSSVLGKEFVDAAFKAADDFNMPMQRLTTEYCWGAVWGREELPKKTRSMLNLAMLSALNRPHELKMHIGGALRNGVSRAEIREVLLQVVEPHQLGVVVLGAHRPPVGHVDRRHTNSGARRRNQSGLDVRRF